LLTPLYSVALGYQHSIANFYLVPIGMFYGTNFGTGKFIYQSVIPVTLGNIVGGALLVGLPYWFLYGRDDTLAVGTGQPLSGEPKNRGGQGTHGTGHGRDDASDETVTAGDGRDPSNGYGMRNRRGDNMV